MSTSESYFVVCDRELKWLIVRIWLSWNIVDSTQFLVTSVKELMELFSKLNISRYVLLSLILIFQLSVKAFVCLIL